MKLFAAPLTATAVRFSLTNVRRLILSVHLFTALLAGALIVILGATGSVMEFEPELDHLLHPHLSYITPGMRVLSLREIGDAVSRRFSGEPVVAYQPSLSPDLSSQVLLPSGVAYVNQYTGEVLGMRSRGQTFLGYARALHVRLASGDFGRNVMKWSGIGMLISLASGAYLWWPIKQVRIRKWGGPHFWFDVHNAIRNLLIVASGDASGKGNSPRFRRSGCADDLQADPFQPDPHFSPCCPRTSTQCCTDHTG
jgi:uncharacterized iron-regulated membrane protein